MSWRWAGAQAQCILPAFSRLGSTHIWLGSLGKVPRLPAKGIMGEPLRSSPLEGVVERGERLDLELSAALTRKPTKAQLGKLLCRGTWRASHARSQT